METTCMVNVYFIYVVSYFTKQGTMLAIWKIPPAARSNGKQNIQFQNKIGRQ